MECSLEGKYVSLRSEMREALTPSQSRPCPRRGASNIASHSKLPLPPKSLKTFIFCYVISKTCCSEQFYVALSFTLCRRCVIVCLSAGPLRRGVLHCDDLTYLFKQHQTTLMCFQTGTQKRNLQYLYRLCRLSCVQEQGPQIPYPQSAYVYILIYEVLGNTGCNERQLLLQSFC